jgi:hypothetical protein
MKTQREISQLKRLKTMLEINSESEDSCKSIKSQVEALEPEPFIDTSIIHYTSEPPCGKHLTDDYEEEVEEFIYTDIKSEINCSDCLSILSPPIVTP